MARKNKPGRYVQLEKKNGEDHVRKGLVYNDANYVDTKVPVYLIDAKWQKTGEQVLVAEDKLIVIGYKD